MTGYADGYAGAVIASDDQAYIVAYAQGERAAARERAAAKRAASRERARRDLEAALIVGGVSEAEIESTIAALEEAY